MAWRDSLRRLRILVLLLVFLVIAVTAWQDRSRSTSWRLPLFVALYPIAADDSPRTRAFIAGLSAERFTDIDRFFAREAHRHGVELAEPLKTRLKPPLDSMPPARSGDGRVATLGWSLSLRWWAWQRTRAAREPADIRVFVMYHDPAGAGTLPHSTGLSKGLIGLVHAFAREDLDGDNAVVIAHEILHTLGATDKYDPGDDAPRFPDGFGDPHQSPLYPQRLAELMGGRRMLSPTRWEQPASLAEVVIGDASALEIRWSGHAP